MVDNQVASYEQLRSIMAIVDDGLKGANLAVIEVDLFKMNQLIDLNQPEDFVTFAVAIKAPVFRTVILADEEQSDFTLDDVEEALGEDGINQVSDQTADQFNAYHESIKHVRWGEPVQIV